MLKVDRLMFTAHMNSTRPTNQLTLSQSLLLSA